MVNSMQLHALILLVWLVCMLEKTCAISYIPTGNYNLEAWQESPESLPKLSRLENGRKKLPKGTMCTFVSSPMQILQKENIYISG